jgi:hypothetical protein
VPASWPSPGQVGEQPKGISVMNLFITYYAVSGFDVVHKAVQLTARLTSVTLSVTTPGQQACCQ